MTDGPTTPRDTALPQRGDRYRGKRGRRGRPERGSSNGTVLDRFLALPAGARWGLGVPGLALTLAALIVLGDVAVSLGRIHPGVRVAGVAVGGLSRDEAAARLSTELGARIAKPVTVRYQEKSWNTDAAGVGFTMDATLTADAAMLVGREKALSKAIGRRFAAVFGGVDVPAIVDAETGAVSTFLDEIDKVVAVPARDADVKLVGLDPQLVKSADGIRIRRDKVTRDILQAFVSMDRSVALTMGSVAVRITDADAQRAMAEAKKMLSGPVTVEWEQKSWKFEPAVIGGWMVFRQVSSGGAVSGEASAAAGVSVAASATPKAERWSLSAAFDPARISETISPLTGVIGRPAIDAQFIADGGIVTIKSSQTGLGPDMNALATDMARTLKGSGARTVTLRLSTIEPALTTEMARAMGIKERISTYTTSYNASQAPRVNNIHVLADALNNKLVPPDGVFDMNGTVGERTAAKGYQIAPGIVNGKLVPQYGGGICQIGTTFFNTVFFSGLPVIERKNHSFYISHYPKGRDCTVTWNGPNFRWKNDTGAWVLIRTSYTGGSVTVALYGTNPGYNVAYTTSAFSNIRPHPVVEVPDPTLAAGARIVSDPGEDGAICTVVRTVTKGGVVVRTDNFVSNYKPKEETVRVGTKPSTPATSTP
jgi:vancomycin resistance protein YoaR